MKGTVTCGFKRTITITLQHSFSFSPLSFLLSSLLFIVMAYNEKKKWIPNVSLINLGILSYYLVLLENYEKKNNESTGNKKIQKRDKFCHYHYCKIIDENEKEY